MPSEQLMLLITQKKLYFYENIAALKQLTNECAMRHDFRTIGWIFISGPIKMTLPKDYYVHDYKFTHINLFFQL